MGSCPSCNAPLVSLKRRTWARMPHFHCTGCGKVWVLEGATLEPCLQPKEHLAESLDEKQARIDQARKAGQASRKGGKS